MNYQERLINFAPKISCENYLKAIKWAKENGYKMTKDISYNGYIYFEKEISLSEHYLDQYKIELQVYNDLRSPQLDIYQKEADFGQSILSETTYRFKSAKNHSDFNSKNLDELFELALKERGLYIKSKSIINLIHFCKIPNL